MCSRRAVAVPVPNVLDGVPPPPAAARPEAVAAAAGVLGAAERPVLWAGGGVERSGAWTELRALAERLGAPVVTTYMGKGAFPADHPLAVGSGCDEAAVRELLETADAVLAIGTELGAETTGQYGLTFSGRLLHLDAAPERIGATYPALGLVGDARATLAALVAVVPAEASATAPPARRPCASGSRAGSTPAARRSSAACWPTSPPRRAPAP